MGWCPSCGAEYLPRVETCADCKVALTDLPPPPPDHDTVTYDFADWAPSQRRMLELLLIAADISFSWEDGVDLVVPRVAESTVDELVDQVEAAQPEETPEEEPAPSRATRRKSKGELAGIGQRALARVIDSLILTVGPTVVGNLLVRGVDETEDPRFEHAFLLWLLFVLVVFLYEVGLTARWGQTLGKRVVGIRVVGPDGADPGWARATRRFLLPFAAAMVPYVGLPLSLAVFLRAAFVPDRRGFHDLFADTKVVRVTRAP